jgi:hypothetical protein
MATRLAWVLNLDADLELGAGDSYRTSGSVRTAMRPHVARLAKSLLGPEDILVDDLSPPAIARGWAGRSFCPTPGAVALLRRAGADPEPHPPVEVLRRVNSRAFASSLGPTMPGAAFVTASSAARAVLDGEPSVGSAWRVKHAFGMAGRNQRVIVPASAREPDLAFVRAGLARGGVQVEPHVAIENEYAIHGSVAADGALRVGRLVRQRCDPRGAWVSTERASGSDALGDIPERLAEEARRVGHALASAGFFGPFGIDAYTYRDRKGRLRFQPRSEINARYSMGFAVGFGEPRAPCLSG